MFLKTPKTKKWLYIYALIVSSNIPLVVVYNDLLHIKLHGTDSVNFGFDLFSSIAFSVIATITFFLIIRFGVRKYVSERSLFFMGTLEVKNLIVTFLTLVIILFLFYDVFSGCMNGHYYNIVFDILFVYFILVLRAGSISK